MIHYKVIVRLATNIIQQIGEQEFGDMEFGTKYALRMDTDSLHRKGSVCVTGTFDFCS